ncbi:hypothetical protein IWY39_001435 [Sphingobium sp. JAI105]|nr:hypothetical protein [Sphingobium sp. JAI105]
MEHNRLQITQDIGGGDADHLDPLAHQPSIAHGVTFGLVAAPMNLAIDLNRKPVSWAEEVQNVNACGMLTAEAKISRARAQYLPEQDFGQGHGMAKRSGAALRVFRAVEHGRTLPLRLACDQPPPLPGEEFHR